MSTITKQFTKDQLIAKAQEQIKLIRGLNLTLSAKEHVDMCSVLFEIALASLEAEREYKHHSVIAEQLAHVLSSMVVTDHQRAVISCAVDRLNNVSQLLQSCPSALLVPETLDYQGAKELYNYLMTEEETNATVNGWNACRAAMLQGAEPVTTAYKFPEETGSMLQLRNLIRQRHAEWSQTTFGDVGPVGPLKHLSKEALEAAAEPEDLSEWADMQFLLWDAQRRAGISDGEITAAMEEKLKVNMARQWPEPKDGEPRLHIKPAPQQEVK